ncbi:maltose/maltodextrin ABC transporter [Cutibacterium acnes JCM 18916]|nr:maltose/maltodextrin ABC transporter [Cutibacterium acnes JCM 18916]
MEHKVPQGKKVSLIELSSEADQQRQSLINAAQTNSAAYDVIGLDLVWVAEFAANRWIVEIPSDTKPVGVIDSVWETGSYRGKQYAVPYTTDAPIMYYRKDFLEQAKVEIPKTWEDVKKRPPKPSASFPVCRISAALVVNGPNTRG